MIERLILSEAAYFYHMNRHLSTSFINDVFRKISQRRLGHYVANIVNETFNLSGNEFAEYSLCVFKLKDKPGFLNTDGTEEEIKYAYLLLVQYNDMLVVSKKNISGLEKLMEKRTSDVDYLTISRLFLSDKAYFEKFSMANMDISNNAIRSRNVEANDLRSSFSAAYLGRYILRNIRIKESDTRISLALNTSRINKLGRKVTFQSYVYWIAEIVNKIQNFVLADSYLDNFSTPLKTDEVLLSLFPSSILFHFNDLLTALETDSIESVEYRYNKDHSRNIELQGILKTFNSYFTVENKLVGDKKYTHTVLNPYDKRLALRKNASSISISSPRLKKIILKFTDHEISLLDYINKNQNFMITFTEVDVIYTSKRLFKDTKLLANLDSFLDVFQEYKDLETVTSEKGKKEDYTKRSNSFSPKSIFNFIETKLAHNSDYLFCDDLGNEFADYISIRNPRSISFYHAKYSNSQMSASDFQEVIGQALKNIGNISINTSQLDAKKLRWSAYYNNTKITLKRIGDTVENGASSYLKALNHPNSSNHIYLVVNYLSKAELTAELNKLKNSISTRPQVIQLFWLLSSFISMCKELGIQAHIICKP